MGFTLINKRVRNYFLRNKIIDERLLNDYYEEVEKFGTTLTQLLVDRNVITEQEAMSVLAVETNLPPLDLDKVEFYEDKLKDILTPAQMKEYKVVPISKIGNIVTIAIANSFDLYTIDKVRAILGEYEVRFVITLEKKINKFLENFKETEEIDFLQLFTKPQEAKKKEYTEEETGGETISDERDIQRLIKDDKEVRALTKEADSSPIVNLVNKIILTAIKEKASDIHIEPMEKKSRVRYRIYGALKEIFSISSEYHNFVISRIKILCGLDIAERRIPQDGKFSIKYENRQIDFRVSILPSYFGEKCVLRILDSLSIKVTLDQLGFDERALTEFRKAINAPYGMILVTGPTGSGKSTTLYAAIREVMTPEENIVTIEDPVEYQLNGITQVQINPKRGLTFASALRSILRQDPDTILVGEIRDSETAEIAIKAALTGHLVLSTLHTNDAVTTISRLIDMGIEPFLVASSLILVSAQRLLKKLCNNCKERVNYPKKILKQIGFKDEEIDKPIFKPVGCQQCHGGYSGRFAILEVLYVDDDIKNLILMDKTPIEIKKYAIENKGMKTLRRLAIENAVKGITSVEEVVYMTLQD
jgi:type IV pilus assembly protein PilB